jgi:hypothetical protein
MRFVTVIAISLLLNSCTSQIPTEEDGCVRTMALSGVEVCKDLTGIKGVFRHDSISSGATYLSKSQFLSDIHSTVKVIDKKPNKKRLVIVTISRDVGQLNLVENIFIADVGESEFELDIGKNLSFKAIRRFDGGSEVIGVEFANEISGDRNSFSITQYDHWHKAFVDDNRQFLLLMINKD